MTSIVIGSKIGQHHRPTLSHPRCALGCRTGQVSQLKSGRSSLCDTSPSRSLLQRQSPSSKRFQKPSFMLCRMYVRGLTANFVESYALDQRFWPRERVVSPQSLSRMTIALSFWKAMSRALYACLACTGRQCRSHTLLVASGEDAHRRRWGLCEKHSCLVSQNGQSDSFGMCSGATDARKKWELTHDTGSKRSKHQIFCMRRILPSDLSKHSVKRRS